MKTYRITLGSFVLPDGSTKVQGELIDLEDDVAATHRHRVELVGEEPAGEPVVDEPAGE